MMKNALMILFLGAGVDSVSGGYLFSAGFLYEFVTKFGHHGQNDFGFRFESDRHSEQLKQGQQT